MEIVNLTPHELRFVDGDGEKVLVVPPSGEVARCSTQRLVVGEFEVEGASVPETRTSFGEVSGLPEPREGIINVVSRIVAEAVRGQRDDVTIVDDTVRDQDGRIIGARSLARL